MWLSSGVFSAPPAGPLGDKALANAAEVVLRERAARVERDSTSRPVRIRESNVLAALREPSRLIEFNRPMPLPSMVRLLCLLWDEEALSVSAKSASNTKRLA